MSYENKISELFKNSYTEVNKNHDEAVIAFENFCNMKNRKIPVMVNYDSHSDVYLNTKLPSVNIANWVNFCFSKLGVVEYYWIIPHYIIQNPNYKKIFSDNENYQEMMKFGPMRAFGNLNEVAKETFFLNKEQSELITQKRINIINEKNKKFGLSEIVPEREGLIPVSIFIVPFNKISILKEKEIALSLDADAFCNSGHDTVQAINNIGMTKDDIKNEFKLFTDAIYGSKVNIVATSLTRSPAYFPTTFKEEITEFFKLIKTSSQKYL